MNIPKNILFKKASIGKMAQWVKALGAKPDNLSSISHTQERANFPKLSSDVHMCTGTHTSNEKYNKIHSFKKQTLAQDDTQQAFQHGRWAP